ncbi:MAG: PAS domain-containing sensor histidine kinase [Candidatus Eremiobacteraeota bacterium]|nr:PAS domain-containing sensor histidine kinase [Candidatus Eremiobacteraeota bacterium]
MKSDKLKTLFAPAERLQKKEILEIYNSIAKHPIIGKILDAIPDMILILNEERQIIFSNRTFRSFLESEDSTCGLGLRPGEAFECIHAYETEGGCGTTEFCKTCGAVKTFLSSQKGKEVVNECRITIKNGEALDLRVWAVPFEINEKTYTFFTITDISHEKRRRVLEKIFFHDILNTAGAMQGFADILREADPEEREDYSNIIFDISTTIVEEIQAQRVLSAAENNELSTSAELLNSIEILNEIVNRFTGYESEKKCKVQIDPGAQDVEFTSDKILLKRVLLNLAKNALEASVHGEIVTMGCETEGQMIKFNVHNPGYIPRDIQLQIFQRSFSTKGEDRGLGTYSIKLLTERYLNGDVSFTTSPEEGTTFTVKYPINYPVKSGGKSS